MTILIICLSAVAWCLLLWIVCFVVSSDWERSKPKPNPLRLQWRIEDLEHQISVPLEDLIAEAERKAIAEFEPRHPRFAVSYVSPNYRNPSRLVTGTPYIPSTPSNYLNPHSFDDRWDLRTITSDQIRAMSMEEYRSFRRYTLTHGYGWRSSR